MKNKFRLLVALDFMSGTERHSTVCLIGSDGYSYAALRFISNPGDSENHEFVYSSPSLDLNSVRPRWRSAFIRAAKKALARNLPTA